MSNYTLPVSLADDFDLMCHVKSTMTHLSAASERNYFIRNLRLILTGDIDDMLAARDAINEQFNKDCDEWQEAA